MAWTFGLDAAMVSTMSPVPSGEPSSTTSTSSRSSCARTAAMMRSILARSLKVGMTTRARSLMPSALQDYPSPHHGERSQQRDEGDQHPVPEGGARERQDHSPGSRGQRDANEREVGTANGSRRAVDC